MRVGSSVSQVTPRRPRLKLDVPCVFGVGVVAQFWPIRCKWNLLVRFPERPLKEESWTPRGLVALWSGAGCDAWQGSNCPVTMRPEAPCNGWWSKKSHS